MTQREDKQRARTSREELGKFFYNLAAMCFGTTVLGSGMALVTDTGNPERLLGMFVGDLYKKRLITVSPMSIRLAE